MDSFSDNVLMQKVQSGDLDKLGLLYQRYKKILFAYFYRQTCIAATSEDLVQNVFHRILIYRKQFRNEGKFSSWMYSINEALVAALKAGDGLTCGNSLTPMAIFSNGPSCSCEGSLLSRHCSKVFLPVSMSSIQTANMSSILFNPRLFLLREFPSSSSAPDAG